ncbi:MAG: DUF3551 domain-containing protein [Pseudolabrys sp.]
MRQSLTLGIVFGVAALFIADAATAQNPPWCAIMDNDGTTQCNFYTQQQCLATISGVGGECIPNPAGSAPNSGQRAPLFGPLFQSQDPGPPQGLGAMPPPPNN